MQRHISGLLLLALLGSTPAHLQAHELWIEGDGHVRTLAYGHEHNGHEGAEHLEYKPEYVKRAACFSAAGQEQKFELGTRYPVTLKGECAASWFLVSSGYWSKTPYGTKNLPKGEAGTVITSWLSFESVKRLDAWSDALAHPLTQALELVPTNNPLALKTGDKLRLRAFFEGKPAANVTVAYFGKPRGVTGADGSINIRLGEPGLQLVEASLELPLSDGKADKVIHGASLQFEIP